jgi:hypothetical protein
MLPRRWPGRRPTAPRARRRIRRTEEPGPAAKALDGTDISWLVGLAVIGPLYFFWVKNANARQRVAAEPVRVAQ